jgi:hypothetical protein
VAVRRTHAFPISPVWSSARDHWNVGSNWKSLLACSPRVALHALLIFCATLHRGSAQQISQYLPGSVPGYRNEPGVTVTSRLHPEYQAPGIRAGDIIVSPILTEGIGYNSNAVGQPQARGSMLIQTQGSVSAQSDWPRNGIGFYASVDDRRYPQQSAQDETDWTVFAGGRYDFGDDQFTLGVAHLNLNQTPRDLGIPQLTQPEPYTVNDVRIAYKANFGRLSLQPAFDFSTWRFDNLTQNGTPFIFNYQDRNTATASITARYELSPLHNLVVVIRNVDNRYMSPLPNQPSRDSTGFAVLAGLDYGTGGVWSYQALVGYEYRGFAAAQFNTISAPIVEADATWTPTGRTTVTGSLVHEIQDAGQTNIAAYTLTQAKLAIDHEYLRNVLLNGQAEVQRASYQQNVSPQTLYNAGAGVTWLLNRNMRLALTYQYWNRQSASSSFAENIGLLQLRLGL